MVFKGYPSVCLTDDCLHVCSEAISGLVFNIHYKKGFHLQVVLTLQQKLYIRRGKDYRYTQKCSCHPGKGLCMVFY